MDAPSAKALVVGALTAAVACFFLLSDRRIRQHGRPIRKAPDTLPLAGNGLLFLQARQKLFAWFVKCERQTGYETLEISVPTLPRGVIVSDPKNLDYVFRHEGTFGKGRFVKQRSWDLFGHGIINADGDLWKAQRKAGLAFLNTANLAVLTDVALPQYLSHAIEQLRAAAGGASIDLQKIFHEITTQLMGKMAYNMEMHADDAFASAFDYASGATAERFQNPLWPVTEILFGARFRASVRTVKAFGRHIVSRATADREAGNADPNAGSLVRSLLDSIADPQVVADAALNYLSAGRDTTAQALTWSFYLLMRHPSVATKVREEARHILHEAAGSQPDDIPSSLFTPLSAPYTLAVFYESLRLYPPVPFEIKQCARPATLPDGTHLPAGSVVVWCPWAMNRSLTTWGPDADEFRPERWLSTPQHDPSPTSKPTITNRSAAEFPVFNGGPRLCLGKKMAELVAVQVIAAVALRFDLVAEDAGAGAERVSKSSLTLPMEGGLPVSVTIPTI